MVEQHHTHYRMLRELAPADGGFAKHEVIERLLLEGVCTDVPVQRPTDPERDPYQPRAGDSGAIAEWRERRSTEPAKAISRGCHQGKRQCTRPQPVFVAIQCLGTSEGQIRTFVARPGAQFDAHSRSLRPV